MREGAMMVLRHVPQNALLLFLMLAEDQLAGAAEVAAGGGGTAGMTVQAMYERARTKWIVSNMPQLQAFLTEFGDHNLVRRGTGEARDVYHVPLPRAELEALVEGAQELLSSGGGS